MSLQLFAHPDLEKELQWLEWLRETHFTSLAGPSLQPPSAIATGRLSAVEPPPMLIISTPNPRTALDRFNRSLIERMYSEFKIQPAYNFLIGPELEQSEERGQGDA